MRVSIRGRGEVLKGDVEVGLPRPAFPLLPWLMHSPGPTLCDSEFLNPRVWVLPPLQDFISPLYL